MKRLKLRKWVKVTLTIVAIIGLHIVMTDYSNKAIEQCVNAGHSRTYCEKGLG